MKIKRILNGITLTMFSVWLSTITGNAAAQSDLAKPYGILILPFASNAIAVSGIDDCYAAYNELRSDPQVSEVTKRTMPVLAVELSTASDSGRFIERPHLECVDAFVDSGGSTDMGRDLCSDLSSDERVKVTRKDRTSDLATELRLSNGETAQLTYSDEYTSGTIQISNSESIKTHICRNTF